MYYMYRNFARTSDSRCLRCNLHRHFSLKRLGEGLFGEGRRDEYYATAHHRRRLRDLRCIGHPRSLRVLFKPIFHPPSHVIIINNNIIMSPPITTTDRMTFCCPNGYYQKGTKSH